MSNKDKQGTDHIGRYSLCYSIDQTAEVEMGSHTPCVVSTEWLSEKLTKREGNLAVLDATWFSNKDYIMDFSE